MIVVWFAFFVVGLVAGCAQPQGAVAATRGTAQFEAALASLRFAAYSPTGYNPATRPVRRARETEIAADLNTLRPYFGGIVTYSCSPEHGLDRIVPIASQQGLRVILGVWDVVAPAELDAAVAQARAHPHTVIGMILGNETLLRGGRWEMIEQAFERVRAVLPNMPLSTSEPISAYGNARLRGIVSFHSPNIHWVFQGGNPADIAANIAWVKQRVTALRGQTFGEKPILIKEHGIPSGPLPYTERLQAEYWREISTALPRARDLAVVMFECYNADWKSTGLKSPLGAGEGQWGAWRQDRTPKLIVSLFPNS